MSCPGLWVARPPKTWLVCAACLGHVSDQRQALSNDNAFILRQDTSTVGNHDLKGHRRDRGKTYSCPPNSPLEKIANAEPQLPPGALRSAATSSFMAFSFQLPSRQNSACLRLASSALATFCA